MTKWDSRFLDLARHVSKWSKDPSTQVGAVLVNPDRLVIGLGFNGFPRGVSDDPALYSDRPTKYLRVVHAEVNAVLNATANAKGATAFVTHPCCAQCMGVLIQAGIKRIVWDAPEAGIAERLRESFAAAELMAAEAGVEICEV